GCAHTLRKPGGSCGGRLWRGGPGLGQRGTTKKGTTKMRDVGAAIVGVARRGSVPRRFGVIALVLGCLALIARPAAAEIPAGLENSRITFLYVAPQSPQ